eukprot:1839464-Prymnesium_polylepis.1
MNESRGHGSASMSLVLVRLVRPSRCEHTDACLAASALRRIVLPLRRVQSCDYHVWAVSRPNPLRAQPPGHRLQRRAPAIQHIQCIEIQQRYSRS